MENLINKMDMAIAHFEKELNSLRTSRANPSMLDNILVDAYGSKTPLNQLGNISIQDASTITIQIWDVSLIKSIENAISESNLGINPQVDGQIIRLPIPKLSEERRKEIIKIASEIAENSRITIRNIRRDFIESSKNEKKNSDKNLHILADVKKEIKKTKEFNKFLIKNNLSNVLIISDADSMKNINKSARNIKNVKLIKDEGTNIYDLFKYKNVIITSSSAKKIQERVLNEKN